MSIIKWPSLVAISLLSLSLISNYSSTQDDDGFAQAYLFCNDLIVDNFSVELAYNTAIELDSCKWNQTSDNR